MSVHSSCAQKQNPKNYTASVKQSTVPPEMSESWLDSLFSPVCIDAALHCLLTHLCHAFKTAFSLSTNVFVSNFH